MAPNIWHPKCNRNDIILSSFLGDHVPLKIGYMLGIRRSVVLMTLLYLFAILILFQTDLWISLIIISSVFFILRLVAPPAVSPVLFIQIVPIEMKSRIYQTPSEVASNLHAAICCVGSPVVKEAELATLSPIIMKWKTAIYLKGSQLLLEAPVLQFYITSVIVRERVLGWFLEFT